MSRGNTDECRKILTPENIRGIAKESVKVAQSYEDNSELKRLKDLLKQTEQEKANQMETLRKCTSDTIREMIFEDLDKIGSEIKNLEKQIAIETPRHRVMTEKQVVTFLTQLVNSDMDDINKRKTLIRVMVNKIYLFDDRYTVTFNAGDEEVTISDRMLSKLEEEIQRDTYCLSEKTGHQQLSKANSDNHCGYRSFLFCEYFFYFLEGYSFVAVLVVEHGQITSNSMAFSIPHVGQTRRRNRRRRGRSLLPAPVFFYLIDN